MTVFRQITLLLLLLTIAGSVTVYGAQDSAEDQPQLEESTDPGVAGTDEDAPADEGKKKKVKDPNRGRFLPIPIFITEPAVGEGLGLALAYFHRPKNSPSGTTIASPGSIGDATREQAPPPTVTGVFGAYTSNETAVAGIGHMNSFKDDHIRFTGAVAVADINSTFYLLDQPFKFNLEGAIAYQETRVRFGDSRWFWGIGLSYINATTAFLLDLPDDAPIDLFRSELTNVGLSGKLAWDTRDNTSMPNQGQLFDLALWRYDEGIGGDYDYWNATLKLLSFHQLHEKFVLGLRLELSAIDGRAPFFAVPWVSLRGIPALRYQGDHVGVFEVEGRYNFTPRWALIGFAGTGKVNSDVPIFDTEQSIYSYGLGGRYQIFQAQNIWVGIDVARGPEDAYWYIQVGHAW
jgi:hypothetical protein